MALLRREEWSAQQRRRFHRQMSDAVEKLLDQGRPDGVTELDEIEVFANLDVRVVGKCNIIEINCTIEA